ncbi:tyrosine-protein phosphatase [Streptomyces anulatus]|uniref:tyrosine-protein phosphatase n=1 Tax=Streptomyces anulatus TaxID=1892 RepID=UPI0033CCA116
MRCVNTRDLGGLATTEGLRTSCGLVVRCAAEQNPVPPVAMHLARTAGAAHLVDLRESAEVIPDRPEVSGITVHRHPLNDPAVYRVRTSERDIDYYVEHYISMLPAAHRAVGKILQLVSGGGPPVVVACRLGKDRTGVVAMVLLTLLGVTEEAAVRDFTATARWFRTHPQWVRAYAESRGEETAAVYRRLVLPSSVAVRTLRHLRGHAAALRSLTDIDRRSLDGARARLIGGK